MNRFNKNASAVGFLSHSVKFEIYRFRSHHYKEKLSATEIKGSANLKMYHADGLKIINQDLRILGRDRESEGSSLIF